MHTLNLKIIADHLQTILSGNYSNITKLSDIEENYFSFRKAKYRKLCLLFGKPIADKKY